MLVLKERVRFVETDLMGVVHHANYLTWFEMGRVEYLAKADVPVGVLMEQGYSFPITDIRCSYKKSARFDDEILIYVQPVEITKVKLIFKYEIKLLVDGSLLAEGQSQNLFTKTVDGSVARIPDQMYKKLKTFWECNI